VGVVDAFSDDADLLVSNLLVSNTGVGLLLLKSEGSLLECPSSLSSSVLRGEGFHLEDKDAASSIIFFYCCLDSWTVSCLQ
jgi:hypothetical protein